MKFPDSFKIDVWWKMVLYLGVLTIFVSLYFQISFIESKHLFGLGVGMVLVGISFFVAEKEFSRIKPPNAWTGPAALMSWKEIRHNPITKTLQFLGFAFIILFGFLIVKNLI